jgi:CRP-like cAMP-binding protein
MIQRERNLPSGRIGPRHLAVHTAAPCRKCPIHRAHLCRAIFDKCAPNASPPPLRHYDKGKLIVEQGTFPGFLGVIRRGYARWSDFRIDGKRILFGLAVPGDIAGALPDQPLAHDLEAATDVEICTYDSRTLKRHLAENRQFRQQLLRAIDNQYHRFLGGIWRYGTLNSRERIIAFVVMATEYMPTEPLPDGSLVLTMEIERRDWADLTNTAVETISRTLRYLEEKALLTSISPYRFRIHGLDRLALIAGVEPPRRQRPEREFRLQPR